ncbi:MAG TPA: DUF4010 domain-containing protein [Candidatus Binataceae bacterium]
MPPLEKTELLLRLSLALAIGLLIGLERGWEQRELPEGTRVAGFRTLGLVGLLGGVAAVLSPHRELTLAALFLAIGMLTAVGYWRESAASARVGETTAVATLLTFALGALAGIGDLTAAVSAAVIATLILGFKPELHRLLTWIDREELLATLRLLLISVVLLPILPNRTFGPWQALNPYQLWWLVVLVAAISYVGYFAVRVLGNDRGVIVTGLFGGLVSAGAVALDLSRTAKIDPTNEAPAVPGIVVASAMMFPRMLAIAAPVAAALVFPLALPLGLAGVVGFLLAGWYTWRIRRHHGIEGERAVVVHNPLELRTAIQFGVLLSVIMVAARGLTVWLGNGGLYLAAAAAGLADVDAITLSVATMYARGETSMAVAGGAILIAAAVNTLIRPAFSFAIAGPRLGFRVTIPLVIMVVAAAIGYWLSLSVYTH